MADCALLTPGHAVESFPSSCACLQQFSCPTPIWSRELRRPRLLATTAVCACLRGMLLLNRRIAAPCRRQSCSRHSHRSRMQRHGTQRATQGTWSQEVASQQADNTATPTEAPATPVPLHSQDQAYKRQAAASTSQQTTHSKGSSGHGQNRVLLAINESVSTHCGAQGCIAADHAQLPCSCVCCPYGCWWWPQTKWVVSAAVGAFLVLRHDAPVMWCVLGSIVSSFINKVCKRHAPCFVKDHVAEACLDYP